MENEKKSLQVNAVMCDMREISEEVLKEHNKININAAIVLMSKESKEIIARYDVSINSAYVCEVEIDAEVKIENGKYQILPGQKPTAATILMVNGKLHIAPNTEDVLDSYTSIIVNGKVICPKSMSGNIANMQINGKIEFYPDNAVILKNTFVLDKVFMIRADESDYYASGRVVILDNSLDMKKLAEKKVHFITPQALISESLAEASVDLFDKETEIILLPDGCTFIDDDVLFSERILRRYGNTLYINGDLTFEANSESALKQLKYLNVNGTVKILKTLQEAFEEIDAIYDDILCVKGIIIDDKPSVSIDKEVLERNLDGITICDCAMVSLSEDIPPEIIQERLQFRDCAMVKCTPEQRSAVELISIDTNITTSKDNKLFDLLSTENTKSINSIQYKF
jgi:hypothetical protein